VVHRVGAGHLSRIVIFLCLLSMINLLPNQRASADLVISSHIASGLPYPLLTNASMPEADVIADIQLKKVADKQVQYDINLTASFLVVPQTSQNISMAFTLPSSLMGSYTNVISSDAAVEVNGTEIDFVRMGWHQINASYKLNTTEWSWAEGIECLVFNATLEESTPTQICVTTNTIITSSATVFYYHYYVGTARTWSGDTHETVTMAVDDQAGFLSHHFLPSQNLTTIEEEAITTGAWEFNISGFDYDYVEFEVQHWEYSKGGPPPDPFLMYPVYLGIGVLVTILLYKGTQRYYA